MPTLSITKTYQDGDILTEADLDNIRTSIQTFINTTGLDSDNIQAGGIAPSDIGINDSQYLEFGTGNDGRIGVVSDDLYIENVTTDKDIIFKGSPAGTPTEIFRVDASASSILMNSKKIQGLANADTAVGSDAVNVTILKQFMPVGSIQIYSATSAPTGWLLCDGSAVSRTTYADLFALINETAGQGDNATTFNVPDFRGRFLRGQDAGAGVDPNAGTRTAMNTGGNTGDAIFSLQADAFQGHWHSASRVTATAGGSADTPFVGDNQGDTADNSTFSNGAYFEDTVNSAGTPRNAAETRPKNANVNFIIKY